MPAREVNDKCDTLTISSLNKFFHIHETITGKKEDSCLQGNINFYSAMLTTSLKETLEMALLEKHSHA